MKFQIQKGILVALSICAAQSIASKPIECVAADKAVQVKTQSKKIATQEEGKKMAEIYEFKAKALDGTEIKLDKYKGDVLLIVNTASACGYTPQYTGLEELHKKFSEKGLKVLGFPCNQFGEQEKGDSHEIASFCKKNYGVDFQMFEKIDVNGNNAHPLYRYLTDASGTVAPIKWNFTKFLVDRHGKVVSRFESAVKPEDMASAIEKQL